MRQPSIGVIGAGVIGRTHAEVVARSGECRLAGIADPTEAGRAFGESLGVPAYADHAALIAARPDAIIVATPNATHRPIALDAIAAGIPVLVEKPIAESVSDGMAIAAASARTGVPVLVGHHRRHNPLVAAARRMVGEGALGRLATAAILYAHHKHDAYFNVAWRRAPGGGPILINLIHEIDFVRFVCGEIELVQALAGSAVRGHEVEDTAGILLRVEGGALVTIALSDAAASPWSWDLASGENPNYPPQLAPVATHFLCGTHGSLSLPTLEHWHYAGARSWFEPLRREAMSVPPESPYVLQLRHFHRVARGREAPLIDAADATRTLAATLAVKEAARLGHGVTPEDARC